MPPSVRGLQSSPDHTRQDERLLDGSSPKPVNITIDESHAPTRARAPLTPSRGGSTSPKAGASRVVPKPGAARQQQNKTRTPDAANRQTNEGGEADNTIVATMSTTNATTPDSAYGTNQPGMMGGGMYGSPYGMGMYGSPYGMGGLGYGGMGMGMGMMGYGGAAGGPFSGLNNFLFGFQNVVFSLGQAMQILGMNTQALHQLFNTAMSMFDHAIATLNDMRALSSNAASEEELPEEEIKRRRRLRAMRWSLVLGISYAGYKIMRRWLMRRRELRNMITYAAGGGVGPGGAHDAGQRQLAYSPYGSSPVGYNGGPGYDSSSMMYMGDGGVGGGGRGYQSYGGYGGYGDAHSSSYRYGSQGYGNRGGSDYNRSGGAGYFPGY
mmetsp:Transcript_31891/g.70671  ORF Transcript_31891/g.70671 Transcript_31891/m.70671 type:complete len:380 (+) Transcript_31891:153-1292(+)